MPIETIFQISNLLVMPFWIVMIFLPRWDRIVQVLCSPWIAVGPAIIYLVLVVPSIGGLMGMLAMPDLDVLAAGLGSPEGFVLGWAHFLTFDLLVGRWIYLDAIDRGLHPVIIGPALFFTLMLGPIGYLIYLITQAVMKKPRIESPISAGK